MAEGHFRYRVGSVIMSGKPSRDPKNAECIPTHMKKEHEPQIAMSLKG